jgi:squalene-hopene/tetraprenyl-beta-curcumene cyclase
VDWLAARMGKGPLPAAPIGFYFARLWYYERLYPAIFTVAAFESVARASEPVPGPGTVSF